MDVDPDRVLTNIREADTEDLLVRATLERPGMEPEALERIDAELDRRGITAAHKADFHAEHADCLRDAAGLPRRCSFCLRPAREEHWGWHRLWGRIPLFPRHLRYCREHAPGGE